MESMVFFTYPFFIMITFVFLSSALTLIFFKQLPFLFLVMLSMVIGYLYSIFLGGEGTAPYAVTISGMVSLLAVGLVHGGLYAGKTAEEIEKHV